MKNTDLFHYTKEAITCNHQMNINEWNTKEGTGKSLKNALDVLQYAKTPLRLKRRWTVKKIEPVVLAVIELH